MIAIIGSKHTMATIKLAVLSMLCRTCPNENKRQMFIVCHKCFVLITMAIYK